MRSELRDKVADLLMEAIQHPERSILLFWLQAYCQLVQGCDPPTVAFSRWAHFVRRHHQQTRWCRAPGETWGRKLVADSSLLRSDEVREVTIVPEYRKELSVICEKASAYWRFLKEMHRRSYPEGLPGVLQQAALLWQHHLFFEFHELLEEVWMEWRGPERPFLQGLIQLGVAFYQIQRNNYRGAMSMFRNGLPRVEPHAPRYCGVDLKKFLEQIEKCRQHVARLGPGRCHHFDWAMIPPLKVVGKGRSAVGRQQSVRNS